MKVKAIVACFLTVLVTSFVYAKDIQVPDDNIYEAINNAKEGDTITLKAKEGDRIRFFKKGNDAVFSKIISSDNKPMERKVFFLLLVLIVAPCVTIGYCIRTRRPIDKLISQSIKKVLEKVTEEVKHQMLERLVTSKQENQP